ncbi:UNVERIFIED_CONTAM: hypothetical protein GTU68_025448 [Idotea baltica]|nr:hypothetical protein [Idotea baltica]
MGPGQFGIDIPTCETFARSISEAREAGAEVCLVIGGGNIFRGVAGAAKGMERAQADSMGMLATIMNALAMQSVLESVGVPTRVQSAIRMESICEPYIRRRAQRHMDKGRASVNLLDSVQVAAYGSVVPLAQVGSVSVTDNRMLSVNIWDKTVVGAADKAIREAGLGLNPVMDGQNLRIPIPALNEERRVELTKVAGKYAEAARVAVRNIRRDGMDTLKKMEKDGDIGEDRQHGLSDEVQKLTDDYVAKVDDALKAKEAEIMQV